MTNSESENPQDRRQTPFSELLRRAMGAHLTGRLDLKAERSRRRLTFKNGLPVRARSNLVREHLLKHLLQQGLIDEVVYSTHLGEVYEGRWERGTTLIRQGLLSAEKLRRAEADLSEEIMMACFGWVEVDFSFHALPPDHRDLSDPLVIDPFSVYVRWLKEEVSARRLQRQIARLKDRHMRLAALGIEHHTLVHRLLTPFPEFQEAIVERHSVSDLLAALGARSERVTCELLALYHLGAIELIRPEFDVETSLGSRDDALSIEQVFSMSVDDSPPSVSARPDVNTMRRILEAEWTRIEGARSPHEVLGVSESAPASDIREAFSRLSRFYSPDSFAVDDPSILERFNAIRETIEEAHRGLVGEAVPRDVELPFEHFLAARDEEQPTDPADVALLSQLMYDDGQIFLKLGEHKEAREHFRQAHRRMRHNGLFMAFFGWTTYLCASDEEPEARENGARMIKQANRLAPDEDAIFVLLGHIYCRTGQSARGSEMYRKALTINPDNLEAARALEPLSLEG